mgnify:FL=1
MSKFVFTRKDAYVFFLIIYIVSLPLNAINIGALGSVLKLVSIPPIAISLMSGTAFKISKPIAAQLAFTLFAASSIIWSVSPNNSIDRVVSYILLFVLLLSGSAFRYSERDISKIRKALVWASRLTAVVVLLFADIVQGRLWLVGIISEDPNYLCAYFSFGVVNALGLIMGAKRNTKKIMSLAELLLYFYLVLLSGSRGGLLAIAGGVIVFVLSFGNKSHKQFFRKIILFVVAFLLITLILDYLPESLRSRFTVEDVIEDGGSGRTLLWEQAFDLFDRANVFRKFFGYGTASARWCFSYFGYSKVNVVHNIFLETLVELGVIGAIIYIIAIASFIKAALKFKDKFSLGVIILMFVLSLSTSIYTFKPYFNIMLFIIITLNIKRNVNHKTEKYLIANCKKVIVNEI